MNINILNIQALENQVKDKEGKVEQRKQELENIKSSETNEMITDK